MPKRVYDENNPKPTTFVPYDPHSRSQSHTKSGRKRLVALPLSDVELKELAMRLRAERKAADELKVVENAERDREEAKKKEELQRLEVQGRLDVVLKAMKEQGFTVDSFLIELMQSREPQQSSRVSRMLGKRGEDILHSMVKRRPDVLNEVALGITQDGFAKEGKVLMRKLRKRPNQSVTEILNSWSLDDVLEKVRLHTPKFWELLRRLNDHEEDPSGRRDNILILVTVCCMMIRT